MTLAQSELSSSLAEAYRSACLAELEALKPGNVHVFADGHGMVVQDFLRSAEASAVVIAQPGLTVGERILQAIDETWKVAGCNTNLGIVLLCAPLLHAILHGTGATLHQRLAGVLDALTVNDAALTYRAILQASPAGLGASERHDVHVAPRVTLLEAMQEARDRDRVALQYANGYAGIFAGAARYRDALQRWQRPAWATTVVFLGFLAGFEDTHLLRKFGHEIANEVREHAKLHQAALLSQENPKTYQRALLDFDRELKARGLNPGTSADLTVASLLTVELENMMTDFASS